MTYLPRRFLKPIFLLALLLTLTSCSGVQRQWQQVQTGGITAVFTFIFSCIMVAIVLLLMFGIFKLQQRYRVLQLLRPGMWLTRIPVIGPYVGQALGLKQDLRQFESMKRTVQDYSKQPAASTRTRSGAAGQTGQKELKELQSGFGKLFKRKEAKQLLDKGQDVVSDVAETVKEAATSDDNLVNIGDAPRAVAASTTAVSTTTPTTTPPSESNGQAPRLDSAIMRLGRAPVPPEFLFDLPTATAENEADFVGRRLDRYQMEAFLGGGTLSNHYQAYDLKLARPVFVKVIHPGVADQENLQERLLQEVRLTAALDHPNIVEIFDYDQYDGHLYLVYELVTGSTVDVYLRHMREQRGHVPLSQMLIIAAQVCDALHYAHAEGIPHGSVQPKHIMLEAAYPHQQTELQDQGLNLTVKITDFGLGQLMQNISDVAPSMWPYLAPEQCTGETADGRADIYSRGVMLYELVTGQVPFPAESLDEAIEQHLYRQPVNPTAVRSSLPASVEDLILKMMAKEPAARFQTAEALADALRRLAATLSDTIEATNPELAGMREGLHAVIMAPSEAPRYVKLEGRRLTLGTAEDNDIVLPGRGVDPHHARLEATRLGWAVLDAGSQTGTYIGNARLLPDLAEEWSARQAIFIGPYEIRQEVLTLGTLPTAVSLAPAASLPLPDLPAEPIVTLRLLPKQAVVEAGDRLDVQIHLNNQGTSVDHFRVALTGLPSDWLWLSDNDLQLLPGAQGFLLLTIQPPRTPAATAQTHPYTVTVRPVAQPQGGTSSTGEVTIRPFVAVQVDMLPERIKNKGTAVVTLANQSNQAITATVVPRDAGEELVFERQYPAPEIDETSEAASSSLELSASPHTLASSETLTVPLLVRAGQRPWLGTSQYVPFEVNVMVGEQAFPQSGQLQITPRIPIWLASLAALLIPFLCLLLTFGGNYYLTQQEAATQATAVAQMTLDAAAIVPTETPAPPPDPTPDPLPLTCLDIKRLNSTAVSDTNPNEPVVIVDGQYTLYLGRAADLPLTIYCHNMAENPTEYLTLPQANSDNNFSIVAYPSAELVAIYEKVRFDPRSLFIDATDRTFAQVSGTPPPNRNVTPPDFGTAMGCNEGTSSSVTGRGNVNLSGTGLRLADSVEFGRYGLDISGAGAQIAPNRQVVTLAITGRCGWVTAGTNIPLEYLLPLADEEPLEPETSDPDPPPTSP